MAKNNKNTDSDNLSELPSAASDKPVITVDYDRYAHYLDGTDLTDEQKQEYLQALWSIIVEFVSLGFSVHPLQQAENACGKFEENSSNSALEATDQLYLDHKILSENFQDLAAPLNDAGQKERR